MARGRVIRAFRTEDAAAAAGLYPEYEVMSERRLFHKLATMPPRAQAKAWVREEAGCVSGFAFAQFEWATRDDDLGYVVVHPAYDELFEVAEAYLLERGARTLKALAEGLEHRGYRREHLELFSVLRPTSVDVPPGPRPLRDFVGRKPELYDLSLACGDLPGGKPEDNVSYDEWLAEALGDPTLDRDGSFVVEVAGLPAAFAWLVIDRERHLARNEMTGTRPELRGRGLALAVKLATVRWAAENGILHIYTSNHEDNVSMLALNRKLGYRVVAEVVDYERGGREGTTANTPSSMTRT